MNIGPSARLLSAVAAVFLFATGAEEWSAQSSGAGSWSSDTSFAALQLRSNGKLKIGLGLGFLAIASIGVSLKENVNSADSEMAKAIASHSNLH
jgi:hypothetical protein